MNSKPDTANSTAPEPSGQHQRRVSAHHLNTRLHAQAQKMVMSFIQPESYTTINLSTLMEQVDPVLLEFLEQLTCPKTRRGRQPMNDLHLKNIRQLYILSVLLFNTNSKCSGPFHVLLTDAMLCHGGSQELVKIMNRVGAVASIDTCNRLATQVVEIRLQEGFKGSLNPDAITFLSLDNLDILQPHAVVAATDATRSWHGTSVQCMQPCHYLVH